jgi:solute carrier family 25 carnitine/acylcarnitine transporter 20/29
MCGGVAGQLSHLFTYPLEVIKTVIQCDQGPARSMRQVAVENYRRSGAKFFYRGLSTTMLQSFISNAIILPLYDYFSDIFLPNENH